jgi:hypothetical protein
MQDGLDKIFGSPYRLKIMRLFLMNPEEVLTEDILFKSTRISRASIRKEIALLLSIGFLKKSIRETQELNKEKKKLKIKKEPGFVVNSLYPYARALRTLVIESMPISREILAKDFQSLGRGLKYVILSGMFIGSSERGLDILIVGDNLKRSKLDKILGKIESDIGKELRYAVFDVNEFKYRESMFDRFVMDVLENDHDILIDNLHREDLRL